MDYNRSKLEILRGQLDMERSSFIPHWRDLADFIIPRRPKFVVTDANRGERRSQKIIDTSPTLALRTLRSGMMSGITSPARPWFRLTTPDPDMAEYGSVKNWLHDVSQRMSNVYLRSNIYNTLPICYGDLGTFGTSPIFIEEDFKETIRTYSMPIGSYMIGNNDKLQVRVFIRDFRMTVRQLVEKFGRRNSRTGAVDWSNFSDAVKGAYNAGQYETWVDVCHVVHPNEDYNPNKTLSKDKAFKSCYYERGFFGKDANYAGADNEKFLSESGYDYFPVLCPRWEVSGEDVYGTDCPGMTALGDIKQLQIGERRGMQAIEKMVNPPMMGPSALRNQKASILPGDITYVDVREGMQGFRPVHEVQFRIQELEQKQAQVRQRISRAFYEDLFLMLASSDRRQITAREIEERHEEKLLALGPVLEQLNQDLLDPLIDITFTMMTRQGMLPPPPEELQGMELKVEYLSIMAQAQKLVGLAGVERFTQFAGQVIAGNPEAMDKVDADQLLDVYSDITSIPPGVVRTDDQVAEIRAKRAEAQKAEQMAQTVPAMASAAKDLGQTPMDGDNALTRLAALGNAGL